LERLDGRSDGPLTGSTKDTSGSAEVEKKIKDHYAHRSDYGEYIGEDQEMVEDGTVDYRAGTVEEDEDTWVCNREPNRKKEVEDTGGRTGDEESGTYP
jgi:hypothetical protein